MQYRTHHRRFLRHFASTPFIWAVLVPMVLLDILLEMYHRICFPLYGIPYVQRGRFFRFNRWNLPYLNPLEKLNCTYCSYANGLAGYFLAVAGATEEYWCGIRYDKHKDFIVPVHHKNFLPYGDEKSFCKLTGKR